MAADNGLATSMGTASLRPTLTLTGQGTLLVTLKSTATLRPPLTHRERQNCEIVTQATRTRMTTMNPTAPATTHLDLEGGLETTLIIITMVEAMVAAALTRMLQRRDSQDTTPNSRR